MSEQHIIFVLELIGTVTFAISGALGAFSRRLDFFGVCFLAMVTAVGGGITRDIILGNTPPRAFVNPIYCAVAFTTALVLFVLYKPFKDMVQSKFYGFYTGLFTLCDAVGLGIFTVTGINLAITLGHGDSLFLLIFTGMITGIGGGMFRDVLVGRIPFILQREIYAVASILGGLLFCLLVKIQGFPHIAAMLIPASMVVVIRMLTTYRNLHLPVVHLRNEKKPPNPKI